MAKKPELAYDLMSEKELWDAVFRFLTLADAAILYGDGYNRVRAHILQVQLASRELRMRGRQLRVID